LTITNSFSSDSVIEEASRIWVSEMTSGVIAVDMGAIDEVKPPKWEAYNQMQAARIFSPTDEAEPEMTWLTA